MKKELIEMEQTWRGGKTLQTRYAKNSGMLSPGEQQQHSSTNYDRMRIRGPFGLALLLFCSLALTRLRFRCVMRMSEESLCYCYYTYQVVTYYVVHYVVLCILQRYSVPTV
ncbi:hypothetical protein BDV19DRAFT_250592 [Aspergillus venezuelensis]